MVDPLALPATPAVLTALPRLAAALRGTAPFIPYAVGSPPPDPAPNTAELPEGLAAIIGTSGSTGSPKRAMLTAAALTASADATHEHLGGPGQWLLALPPHHIAGLQVLLRSVVAQTTPIALDLTHGFTATAFTAAVGQLDPRQRRYTSLVPAQLGRLLDDPAAAAALASLDAVLLGGQALDPRLRARAQAAGVTVIATYGMTETAGGCVYDGQPLNSVRIAVEDTGRILLGGPTLAAGYLADPAQTAAAFHGHGEQRWFRTDDSGTLTDDARLHVEGRLDDLINTGGLKVAPRLVEEAITARVPQVADVCVVGIPDPHWGQAVAAALVPAPGVAAADLPTLPALRTLLADALPAYALPQRLTHLDRMPQRGPGKTDRAAVRARFAV